MLYEMKNPSDFSAIAKYGKAYGTALLQKWLPNINRTKNMFVIDSYDEFLRIADKLPEVFSCRADAKTGEKPTFRVEGHFVRKEDVEDYIARVKKSNPNGVVLCIDTEEGTQEKIKTDGAFNVYFNLDERVMIDYLGKGFDMGAITKGKELHENWIIDWEDLLFITPNNMNQHRQFLISDEEYIKSARRRLEHLLQFGYKPEDIKGKIPKAYSPMPMSSKEKILNEIVLPLYVQRYKLRADGLTSFGVQGMILNGELFPIEVNRQARFAPKSYYEQNNGEEER